MFWSWSGFRDRGGEDRKGTGVGDETKLKPAGEVTAGTAARILDLPIHEIERMCAEGKLRARRIGERGWYRIEYVSVLEWFAKEKQA
jgi:hypothetical protein